MRRAILPALFIAAAGSGAQADSLPFFGEVMTVAGRYCPKGFAPLNGQLLPINQNQALFALLGTNYGGDGQRNFALPSGRTERTRSQGAPLVQCIALQGVFPSRN